MQVRMVARVSCLFDTNVASQLMRSSPASTVAAWISARHARELYLTAVSEAELLYGVAIMPAGRRRNRLEASMTRWLDQGFGERILPFDSAAARAYPTGLSATMDRTAVRPWVFHLNLAANLSKDWGPPLQPMTATSAPRPKSLQSSFPLCRSRDTLRSQRIRQRFLL